jgi:hypothetical protein
MTEQDVIPRQRCRFVATFSDGVVVSTPTIWNGGNPSVERAKFFAKLAYRRQTGNSAPAIVKAHLEVGRKPRTVLRVCSAVELDAEPVSTAAPEPEPVQRRRGRPRGSKNKQKTIADTSTSNAPPSQHEKSLLTCIEASLARGDPAVPLELTSVLPVDKDTALSKAIAMVRAAGYRIDRPKASKIPRPKKKLGPSCIVEFADGTVTRMTVFTSLARLDWDRAERLAKTAYVSRWRTQRRPSYSRAAMQWWKDTDQKQREAQSSAGSIYAIDLIEPALPAIVAMRFEARDGTVLGRRPDGGGGVS